MGWLVLGGSRACPSALRTILAPSYCRGEQGQRMQRQAATEQTTAAVSMHDGKASIRADGESRLLFIGHRRVVLYPQGVPHGVDFGTECLLQLLIVEMLPTGVFSEYRLGRFTYTTVQSIER